MQLKTSLVLSALFMGLAAAQGSGDQYDLATDHSTDHSTEYLTEYSSEHTYPQTTTSIPSIFPTSGYANYTTTDHHNSTATSSQHGSSTSGSKQPTTTRLPSTPTSINAAGRSQFGLAVFGLAVAAGLGL